MKNKDDRFRFIIENSNQGYLVHRNHKALYVNDEFVRLYGYDSAQEIYDLESTQQLIAPEWRNPNRHGAIMTTSNTTDELDYLGLKKDGSTFWVNRRSFGIEWDGEPAVCSARKDITARVEYERKLAEAVEAAEKANQAKTELMSAMSHELRTPLNTIIGFSELLENDPDNQLNENQLSSLSHISNAATNLLGLVNDVLQVSDLDREKIDLAMEPVQVSNIFGECLRPIEAMIEQHGITLEIEPDPKRFVTADHIRLKQAVLNLMMNAVKFNRRGGKVMLRSSENSDGRVRMSIIDTGHGIAEGDRDRVFLPFERLGDDTTHRDGMGIGLPVAKSLIEAMGGEIGLHSVVGEGSTFWIELPPATDPQAALAGHEGAFGDMPSEESLTGNVLYVDDNPSNLELMEMILEISPGVNLTTAASGEMGVASALEDPPDLLLLDINLPGMNGLEALAELRRHDQTKDIPAVAISAAATPSDVEKGLMAGFDMYLTKPLDIEEVRQTVAAFLRAKDEI